MKAAADQNKPKETLPPMEQQQGGAVPAAPAKQ